jgi:hypothetical protein
MKSYTQIEIEAAWEVYQSKKVITYLDGGVKKFKYLDGQRLDMTGIMRAQTVDLKTVMSFPEFLEKRWPKEK